MELAATRSSTALRAHQRLAALALRAQRVDEVLDALLHALRAAFVPEELHLHRVEADAAGLPAAVAEAAATGAPVHRDSTLYVPVGRPGDARAVVTLAAHGHRAYGEDELRAVATFADVAGGALTRIDLESRLASEDRRHLAVARAAASLNESLDLDDVLAALCREASLAVGTHVSRFFLAGEGGEATSIAAHGPPEVHERLHLAPGQGIAGRVIATGGSVICAAYEPDAGMPDDAVARRVQTGVGVPVRWNGELRGALCVASFDARRVTRAEVETLEAIAELAALACRNAEAFEQALRAAATDSLTGVLNHGAMQARIGEEISRARRDGTPLSCLLVDLDDFKGLNDSAGHAVGDELLRAAARALATEARPYDVLARYGGDEFVLILPGADEHEAREIALRAQDAIRAAGMGLRAGDAGQGSSIGVAQWREPSTASELLERADRALLLAKRRGKDRVEVASAATDQQLALEGSGGRLMSEFWRLVSSAHSPREALLALPALLRTELGVAEVGVYLQASGRANGTLERIACAGDVDRPAAAFAAAEMGLGPEAWSRLEAGPLWRGSLPELLEAIDGGRPTHVAPAGSYAAIALGRPGRPVGLIVLHADTERFPLDRLQQAWALASQAAAVLVATAEGADAPDALAELAEAVDARERASQHRQTQDVVALACEVARVLGLPAGEIERVRHGALLHDIGKASIPSDVLLKPGPLEPAEIELVRQHPIIGERILRRVPELADVAPVVRHEHERWDGAGYPDGLAGADIPIGSRIVLACDAFHAMTTQRPYRKPLAEYAALAELRRHAGSQFDPEVVDALMRVRADAAAASSVAAA